MPLPSAAAPTSSDQEAENKSRRERIIQAIQDDPRKALALASENLKANLAELPPSHLQVWQKLVFDREIMKICALLSKPTPEERSLAEAHPFGGILT